MDALFNTNAACSTSSGRDSLRTLVDATTRHETPFLQQAYHDDATEHLRPQRRVFTSQNGPNCHNEFPQFEAGGRSFPSVQHRSLFDGSLPRQGTLESLDTGPSTRAVPRQQWATEFHTHVVGTDRNNEGASWEEKWMNTGSAHSQMLNDSWNSAAGTGICHAKEPAVDDDDPTEEYSEAYASENMTLAYLKRFGGNIGPKYSRIVPGSDHDAGLNRTDGRGETDDGGKFSFREFERYLPGSSADNQSIEARIPAHLNWGLEGIVDAERAFFDEVFTHSHVPTETKWDWERLSGISGVDQDTIAVIPESGAQEEVEKLCKVSIRRLALLYQQLSGGKMQ